MKSIFKAVATVTLFSILTRLLGFFFRILLSRKLGAEGLGLFQLAASMLSIFLTIVASGLPLTTAKLVSKNLAQNNIAARNRTVTTSLIISVIVSIICSVIILALYPLWKFCFTDDRAVKILYALIPSILFSAIYSIFRGALWGQDDYFSCGLTELVEQIVRFVFTFLLINSVGVLSSGLQASIAFDITCLISALFAMIIYLKNGRFSKPKDYRPIISSAVPITGVRMSSSLISPITSLILPGMLILAGYSRSEAISSFGIMMGMSFPMLFSPMAIIGSISMVLIPSISSLLTLNKTNEIENKIKASIDISLFLTMIFVPLFLSVGDKIGIVLFNSKLSGEMMQYSCICIVPIGMCNLSGSILNALNQEHKSFKNYLWGSGVLIISLIAFTPLVGIYSIAVAYFLAMSLITILNIQKIKIVYPNLELNFAKSISKYTIVIIPSSLFGHFLSNICNTIMPTFFSGLIGGGACLIMFLACIYVFNIFDIRTLIKLVKTRKFKKLKPIKNV